MVAPWVRSREREPRGERDGRGAIAGVDRGCGSHAALDNAEKVVLPSVHLTGWCVLTRTAAARILDVGVQRLSSDHKKTVGPREGRQTVVT
jgi:hypothetical protein